jgi:hypothetical protein
MIGTFLGLRVIGESIFPKIQFEIELTNDNSEYHGWICGWTGQLYLIAPKYLLVGNVSPDFMVSHLTPSGRTQIRVECEFSPEKLDAIEEARQGKNIQINIILNVLSAIVPKTTSTPPDISSLRTEQISVRSPSNMTIEIPRSYWDDVLEKLNYQSIVTIRLPFPSPPLRIQLDKSVEYLKDAQKKINDGEWADSLTSSRKAIEELQKFIGGDAEQRKAFFQNLFKDEEKTKNCDELWEAIKKTQWFASGGPHTYWVRTADKRDAELAIRIVSAFIYYFAQNFVRVSNT